MSMTRKQANIGLTAILTTAAEIHPDPMPLGPAYAALNSQGYSLSDWDCLIHLMDTGGLLATRTPETITLTARGREIAWLCESHAQA